MMNTVCNIFFIYFVTVDIVRFALKHLNHAAISAITLVYCDQLEPSPPSPSPLFLLSPPCYSPAYGNIPMTEVDLEGGILNTDTEKMEMDDSEGHFLIYNKALVGSQYLEVLIPVDDVSEKYAGK